MAKSNFNLPYVIDYGTNYQNKSEYSEVPVFLTNQTVNSLNFIPNFIFICLSKNSLHNFKT